jgi:UDP-N-acetyl-D-mannosaminuronic acid dehydrogenase
VLPGQILRELVHNDRVVGGMTPRCAEVAAALYRSFLQGECFLTTARTAELCKLTENSFRDVNIAFANELSMICAELGVNVWELIRLANRHPRVNILQPGPGVGGHCIAIDPWFIVASCPEHARLVRTAREVNDSKPHWVRDRVNEAVTAWLAKQPAGSTRQPLIACLGLAFKADVDDLRESPAVEITNIRELPPALAGIVRRATLEDAIASCDIVVLLVDHKAFRALPLSAFEGKSLVDTRGLLSLH